jgi:hypothetical protein
MSREKNYISTDRFRGNELERLSSGIIAPGRESSPEIGSQLVTDVEPFGSNIYIQKSRLNIFFSWASALEKYRTIKGRLASLLELFPKELRINQTIIPVEDKNQLRTKMEELIASGQEVGLRTCFEDGYSPYGEKHKLGINPWTMGMRMNNQIRAFFGEIPFDKVPLWEESQSENGNRYTYDKWLKMKGIKEIIVMENPNGLWRKEYFPNDFVFRLNVDKSGEPSIELTTGTNALRDLDGQIPSENRINIFMPISSHYGIYRRSDVKALIGKKYLDEKISEKKGAHVFWNQGISWKRGIDWNGEDNPMTRGIKPEYRKMINDVLDFVFIKAWNGNPQKLYHMLCALYGLGINSIEFQGKHKEDGEVEWIKIYGLRGGKEFDHYLMQH